MAPKDGSWLHCGCDISCITHGGPQKRALRVHIDRQSRILAMINWLMFGDGSLLKHPKTAECRSGDAVICGPPVRQAQAACANFCPHAPVKPRSLTVSSQPLSNATGSRRTVLPSLFHLAPQTAVATADPVVSSVFAPSCAPLYDPIPARVLAV